jgi:hypothetical protein
VQDKCLFQADVLENNKQKVQHSNDAVKCEYQMNI